MAPKSLKDFVVVNDEFTHRDSSKDFCHAFMLFLMERMRSTCIGACRGRNWPEMAKHVAAMQKACTECQEALRVKDHLFVEEAGD